MTIPIGRPGGLASVAALPDCACGCGKKARSSLYHTDCANECKCGCGGRARYSYRPGHRPEVVCKRCAKVFKAVDGTDAVREEMCAACRRHVRDGGPLIKDESLITARRMQKQSPEGRRWCSGCEQYRLLKFFKVRPAETAAAGEAKYYSRCKPCHKAQLRASSWLRSFGITPEQYEQIKDQQGGRCAICQTATGATKALAIDHDHSCTQGHDPKRGCPDCVRGCLCSSCNQILGFARDNPDLFLRAYEYLILPPAKEVLSWWLQNDPDIDSDPPAAPESDFWAESVLDPTYEGA